MTQAQFEKLVAHLVHLGDMPRDAYYKAVFAQNNLPAGATFDQAFDYIKTHFEI